MTLASGPCPREELFLSGWRFGKMLELTAKIESEVLENLH